MAADFEDLGQGVYLLDARYGRPGVACFYAIVGGDQVAFVETGVSASLQQALALLVALDMKPEQVRFVMPTHVHLDHAGGAGAMMRAFPEAELIVHPRGARHLIDPSRLIAGTRAVYGDEAFDRLYGEIPPVSESRVIAAGDGGLFELGGRQLRIVDTPGHAYHHFCVVDEASRGIFTGDTFGLSYPRLTDRAGRRVVIPTTTPVHFNPEALKQSVRRLMAYRPERVYLTHFGPLPDPASRVGQYLDWIDRFVAITEEIQPREDMQIPDLARALGEALAADFGFDQAALDWLQADLQLNAQGLAHWFRHRDD
jgi:glyoxylase-like metal-dependent hydrolase (beta-lactamase superfamily II)